MPTDVVNGKAARCVTTILKKLHKFVDNKSPMRLYVYPSKTACMHEAVYNTHEKVTYNRSCTDTDGTENVSDI